MAPKVISVTHNLSRHSNVESTW